MDKITRLTKELVTIEEEKEKAEKLIESLGEKYQQNYLEIAKAYHDFFEQKRNKEFVYYQKFPSVEALDIYAHRSSEFFPLYNHGRLNVAELAEVIRHLYQFHTGKNYQVLTIGTTERDAEPVYGGKSYRSIPHLNILIGNEETLAPYQELSGTYTNNNRAYLNMFFAHKKDLINIDVERFGDKLLDIECLTGSILDKERKINYYNTIYDKYDIFEPNLEKQIFSSNIRSNLNSSTYKTKGIKDAFSFQIHPSDSYLAKVLVSMVIYKRNNQLREFSSEDYHHIFDVLYGENVDIIGDAKKDIPKQLRYIPDKKSGR